MRCEKTIIFEVSLRLSRACLGKMIIFSTKSGNKDRFLTWELDDRHTIDNPRALP